MDGTFRIRNAELHAKLAQRFAAKAAPPTTPVAVAKPRKLPWVGAPVSVRGVPQSPHVPGMFFADVATGPVVLGSVRVSTRKDGTLAVSGPPPHVDLEGRVWPRWSVEEARCGRASQKP